MASVQPTLAVLWASQDQAMQLLYRADQATPELWLRNGNGWHCIDLQGSNNGFDVAQSLAKRWHLHQQDDAMALFCAGLSI